MCLSHLNQMLVLSGASNTAFLFGDNLSISKYLFHSLFGANQRYIISSMYANKVHSTYIQNV